MTPSASVSRLTQAAFKAKDTIDRVQDIESLEKAFLALGRFAILAVKTPFCVQDQAEIAAPSIPVMAGLLQEIHAATVRLAKNNEESRLRVAS
jgi:hypothetical protein